jgi:UDP-glucose 4-epimerase
VKGDICDANMLEKIFKQHQFNAEIHFTAVKSVAESGLSPLGYCENNVAGKYLGITKSRAHKAHTVGVNSNCDKEWLRQGARQNIMNTTCTPQRRATRQDAYCQSG